MQTDDHGSRNGSRSNERLSVNRGLTLSLRCFVLLLLKVQQWMSLGRSSAAKQPRESLFLPTKPGICDHPPRLLKESVENLLLHGPMEDRRTSLLLLLLPLFKMKSLDLAFARRIPRHEHQGPSAQPSAGYLFGSPNQFCCFPLELLRVLRTPTLTQPQASLQKESIFSVLEDALTDSETGGRTGPPGLPR